MHLISHESPLGLKGLRLIVPVLLGLVVLNSCDTGVRAFDSSEWKTGSRSSRGAMARDLVKSERLIGKTAADVEALLGQPDRRDRGWFGYGVVTIARCHVWECRIDVVFDVASGRVKSVAVSD
jgi:hypothetical protein